MEIWEVLAVDKKAQVTIREEGKVISGLRYLLKGNEPAGKDDRYACFNWREQFISNERLAKLGVIPCPGDTIQLFFNRYGDIEMIKVLKDEEE